MNAATKPIARNRKARFNYHISDTYEAGIQLLGSEVKSLRDGRVDFRDAYATFDGDELLLIGLHISEYPFANQFNHDPNRTRKLLMWRRELNRLKVKIREQGFTLVPTSLYFKNGKVKVELGLAKGKRQYDKREALKQREANREIRRTKGGLD